MSNSLGYRQRLVVRDLFRKGPRTTDQLASWWGYEGGRSGQGPESEPGDKEEIWAGFNCTAHASARQGLYELACEGLISSTTGELSSSGGRRENWWALTPRGLQVVGRIDDELGPNPAELLIAHHEI